MSKKRPGHKGGEMENVMTYNQILNRLSRITPEYEHEARLLCEAFAGEGASRLLADRDRELDSPELEAALAKREERIPLQYIIGKWDFYRQTYFVNEDCLIPRSDTEILVEQAIDLLPKNAHFADFCTGSGCIAVSVLAERQDTSALMVDKFERTLALAVKNAKANKVSDRAQAMLLDLLASPSQLGEARFDAILSNPPYIRSEIVDTLSEEVKKEPRAALDGGEDGLIFYRTILNNYSQNIVKGGFVLFEIGYDQGDALRDICGQMGLSCEILKDYSGNDRVAKIFGF